MEKTNTLTAEEAKKRLNEVNESIAFTDPDATEKLLRVKEKREALRQENESLAIGDVVIVKSKKKFLQATLTSGPKDVTHKLNGKPTQFRVVEYVYSPRNVIYRVEVQTHNVVKIG